MVPVINDAKDQLTHTDKLFMVLTLIELCRDFNFVID